MKIKWNLQRLKFMLGHIEDFIETDWTDIRERAKDFSPQTGLASVNALVETPAIASPEQVFERLTPFFDSGLLLRDWKVTDVFWRGSVFHLDVSEQTAAPDLAFSSTPNQVSRAPAAKILTPLKMEFLIPTPEANGYLLQPAPAISYILFSNLADPWALEHVSETHRLINKAFVY